MDKDVQRMLETIKYNNEKKQRNSNKAASADSSHNANTNSVTKSNALARAYYRYGLVEKRIMETLISQLNPLRTDNRFQEIELTALAYSKAFNVDVKHSYEHLEKAVTGLTKRVISVAGEGIDDDRIEWPLMAEARYRRKAGRIICTFNPKVVPHLAGMRNRFTKYPLAAAIDFTSSYTWRFYELLMSWAKTGNDDRLAGWLTVEVVELRKMLGVPKSYTWTRFQEMVLDVVETELQGKANIHMNIERRKTSRKITHLYIEFIELPLEGEKTNQKKAA